MFRLLFLALLLHIQFGPVMEGPPDLVGLSTWYGPPAFREGDTMADGTPLRLGAATVAVDVSHRAWLGREALVLTGCGLHRARVADTGRLYAAGLFRLGVRDGVLRYWPVGEDPKPEWELAVRVLERPVLPERTHWLDGDELPVVADFPERFYADEVACQVDAWGKGDTMKVQIWVLDD